MTLPRLPRQTPPLPVGIVHLGLGAFFRAHGAVYTQDAIAAEGGDWGILGVSLQSPTMRDQLAPQGGAYTALELGPEGAKPQQVEVVQGVLVAREDPAAVIAAMTAPGVRIVTLTVTEKGYCHEPSTGRLNPDHPDIAHDLTAALPRSAPGFLVRALQARREAGLAPFTVLSCDNLPSNGVVVRGVILDLAQRIDQGLADWIAAEVAFPSAMVDRIVPATQAADIAQVEGLTGRHDAAPVLHEPFRQWVIEDHFPQGRPAWDKVGAQMVADVTPFEHMKLRMLNGTHSSLAYLGYLAGYETIADTTANPGFAAFARHLWAQEIIPALETPPGADLPAYADALLARYRNPAIRHRTWQIAMDGSQKLPQRILGTIAANLEAGRDSAGLYLAVAGWIQYVSGRGIDGAEIDVRDPLAAELKQAATAADPVAAVLALRAIFPEALAERLKAPVAAALSELRQIGPAQAAARIAQH